MMEIRKIIAEEFKKLSIEIEAADLERPKKLENGDLSFFVKDKSVNPEKLPLKKINHEYVEKTEVAGRFINFHLSKKFFRDSIERILGDGENKEDDGSGGNFGRNKNLEGEKIIFEYTNPNPFKEFHIGHLMSNTVGESLSRIFSWSGASVTRANYQGDIGPQVAKALWGMLKLEAEMPKETATLNEKIGFIGGAYVLGSNAYEESWDSKEEIDALNKTIYEKSVPEINRLYDWGRKVSLEHFEEIYNKLGTKFDLYFFESETAAAGLSAVEELVKKGILEKSDGAIIFRGEKYGLHTRVFVNSRGLPTYETKELGLSKMKFARRDFDRSVVITANEQSDYFAVALKVLEFVDHRAANRTRHVSHGMLRFAEGKMSSRKGNVITGESLISDVEKLVQEKTKNREFLTADGKAIAEIVAVGAIKYSILKQSPGRDIIFDFNKSLSFEGDSGPYLQYTHARACSILKKAIEAGIDKTNKPAEAINGGEEERESPTDVERLLVCFPEIVERAQKEYAPQLITTYLTQLASSFNRYYAENTIIDGDKTESTGRVRLVGAVKEVLQNGLYLLGIRAPERM